MRLCAIVTCCHSEENKILGGRKKEVYVGSKLTAKWTNAFRKTAKKRNRILASDGETDWNSRTWGKPALTLAFLIALGKFFLDQAKGILFGRSSVSKCLSFALAFGADSAEPHDVLVSTQANLPEFV